MEMIPNAEREKIYKERTKRVRVGILTTFVGHSDVGDKFMWVRDSSNIRHQQLSPISVKPFLGSHAYVFEYSSFRLKFKRNSLSPYIICCYAAQQVVLDLLEGFSLRFSRSKQYARTHAFVLIFLTPQFEDKIYALTCDFFGHFWSKKACLDVYNRPFMSHKSRS